MMPTQLSEDLRALGPRLPPTGCYSPRQCPLPLRLPFQLQPITTLAACPEHISSGTLNSGYSSPPPFWSNAFAGTCKRTPICPADRGYHLSFFAPTMMRVNEQPNSDKLARFLQNPNTAAGRMRLRDLGMHESQGQEAERG